MEQRASNATPVSISGWWTPKLAGPVIAAAVVRTALLTVSLTRIGPAALLHADTSSYLIPGRNLLLHGSFVADGVPDLLRPPGYPLFLAFTSLAGLPAAGVANVILSVFSVILVWKLGRSVFSDDRIAIGAGWIFAFEPLSVASSNVLVSETLFLLLFLLSLERLANFLRGHRLPVLAVAGLWLAAATFVRPVTYYLPLALAIGLFVLLVRVPGLRWQAPAILLICVLPWLAAWQIRNWVQTGYGGFSSISDENLYFLAAGDVKARIAHRSPTQVSQELGFGDFTGNSGQSYLYSPYLKLHPEQNGWSQAQRLAFMHSDAVSIIRAHYSIYLRSCLADLFKTVFYPAVYNLVRPLHPRQPTYATVIAEQGPAAWRVVLARARANPWVVSENAVFGLVLLGLYFFAALGIYRGGANRACGWLLFGTSVYFLIVSVAATGALPSARLRLPVMPVVCILAAAGFLRGGPPPDR